MIFFRKFSQFAVLAATVLLTGCGSVVASKIAALDDNRVNALMTSTEMRLLEGKVNYLYGAKGWSIAQLSDPTFPTEEQRNAVLVWDKVVQDYMTNATAAVGVTSPESTLLREATGAGQNNRLELYRGLISFGQFNQNAKKLYEVVMQMYGRIEQANAEQTRAAWAQAMQNYQNSQPIRIQNQTAPSTTNCTRVGNNVNCRTN